MNEIQLSTEQAIFEAALSVSDAGKRDNYLNAACRNDQALRQRIESLLSADSGGGSFMRKQAIDSIVDEAEQAGEMSRETPFDGARDATVELAEDSLAGETLGPYRIVSLIGSGGMGHVFLADDPRLGRKVALKVIVPERFSEARSRFSREARLASALDHPNICAIHDIGESSGRCFIAMQYLEGQTLKQVIGVRPLAINTWMSIALQVADALRAAHEQNIIHRDIKPGNIIITPGGTAKVLDFGLAKLLGPVSPEATQSGRVVGTPTYMSPEQARGEEVDQRSDIFSLGAVLYHMATGSVPFRGASSIEVMHAVITESPTPVRKLNADTPPALAAVIDRALAKSPCDRYQSVEEMSADLRAISEEVSPPSVPAFVIARARRRRLAAAVVAVVSLIAVAGWYAWQAANVQWALAQIPEIEKLAQAGRSFVAYDLAVHVRKYVPNDSRLTPLLPLISDTLSVTSEPPGARVYLRRFGGKDVSSSPPRELIGTAPLSDLEIARGDYVISVEKEGHVPFERTLSGAGISGLAPPRRSPPLQVTLTPNSKAQVGMIFIPGGEYRLVAWRRPIDALVKLDGYFIDKYEVTNRQYKEFIIAGGYQMAQFWAVPFVENGRALTREAALRDLVDQTELPGPRRWSDGSYPEGKADHPVTGITWYEAAAYASWCGKSLPTVFQWEKAARNSAAGLGQSMPWGRLEGSTVGRANFAGSDTVPVGSLEFGMSPFGCYEMAGNAAEWCLNEWCFNKKLNEMSDGFITSGGSWASLEYEFGDYGMFPADYESDEVGFRCVLNLPDAAGDQGGMPIDLAREVPKYTPAPEDKVKGWFKHYDYDTSAPLNARVLEKIETDEWRREKIEYNGAKGERVLAYLYLPKHFPPPHQVIHIFPAGDVGNRNRTVPEAIEKRFGSFVRSGRAVFSVVMRGFRERDRPDGWVDLEYGSVEYLEDQARHLVDLRRGLDYLESRKELDADRIVYCKASQAFMEMVLPAIEPRYKAVVMWGVGLVGYPADGRQEANPMHFAPLMLQPKLILHGEYDEANPYITEGKPFHDLMPEPKTPPLISPRGHAPDPVELVKTVNKWLNDTLGSVRQK